MLKRIRTEDVRLGMFLHKLEGPWLSHPFWKTKFLLEDPAQLADLKASAIEWVQIDVTKGGDVDARPAPPTLAAPAFDGTQALERRRADVLVRARQTQPVRPAPRPSGPPSFDPLSTTPRPLAAEMPAAAGLARKSTIAVRGLFEQARLGRAVKLVALEPMIDEISSSIQRHPHAFTGLLRLMKTNDYLYMHSLSVCALMISLATELKLSPDQRREAGLAGLLMDVGMGHVPQEIYDKDDELTPAESQIVHSHTRLAHDFMSIGGELTPAVLDVCLHHHERWDGSGYPDRLSGEEISLFSRMAAVCDTYDAMTSFRPHKAGEDPSVALLRMEEGREKFDPWIFDAFVRSVGIYPAGSLVRLGSDRLAIVVDQNAGDPLLPRVRAFWSIGKAALIRPEEVDLSDRGHGDCILSREQPEAWPLPDWAALRTKLFLKGGDAPV